MSNIINGTLGLIGSAAFTLYRAALFARMVLAWTLAVVVLVVFAGIALQAIWSLFAG